MYYLPHSTFCVSDLSRTGILALGHGDSSFYSDMPVMFCFMLAGSCQPKAAFVVFDRLHDQEPNKHPIPTAFHPEYHPCLLPSVRRGTAIKDISAVFNIVN